MKDAINLLPPKIRHVRSISIYLSSVGRILHLVIMALTLLLLITLTALWTAKKVGSIIEEKNSELVIGDQGTRQKIEDINGFLRATEQTIDVTKPHLNFITEILEVVPAGIQLTGIALDETTGKILVSGLFNSRENVVTYQRRLEALPEVSQVNAPLSNFKTGSQSAFTFSIVRQETSV